MELHFRGILGTSWFLSRFVQPPPTMIALLIGFQVTGRIIIDAQAFGTFNPHRAEAYDELDECDYTLSDLPATKETAANSYSNEEVSPNILLTDFGHLICKATLLGYSMKLKKWSRDPSVIHFIYLANRIKCTFSLIMSEKLSGMIMPLIL